MPLSTANPSSIAQTTKISTVARRAQTKTNVRISLDIGYHSCVAYDGQQVSTLRSVYAKMPIGQKAPMLPNTFTLQFGGNRYLVGEGALTPAQLPAVCERRQAQRPSAEARSLRPSWSRQSRSRYLALQRRRVRRKAHRHPRRHSYVHP